MSAARDSATGDRTRLLVVNDRIQVPLDEFHFSFARSSGPGGQNVNKVNSKAVLRWPVASSASVPDDVRQRFISQYRSRVTTGGDLVLSSQQHRDQTRNIHDCLERLRSMLAAVAVAPRRRKRTRPSRGSVERRLQLKKRRASLKQERRRGGWDG